MTEFEAHAPRPSEDKLFHQPTDARFWKPTDAEAEARILAIYERATPDEIAQGRTWYADVHQFARDLSSQYDLEATLGPQAHVHVCGVIAVLSPRLEWEQNLAAAEAIIRDGTYNGIGRASRTALEMLDGEHPEKALYRPGSEGYKVQAFFDNIRDPEGSYRVTLDRHMWNLIYSDTLPLKVKQAKMGEAVYNWGEDRIRAAASERGLAPLQLQAIDWVVWRRQLGYGAKSEEPHPTLFDDVS